MPFDPAIQQALQAYHDAVAEVALVLGLGSVHQSIAITAIEALPDNKRQYLLEILLCFLKNVSAVIDPWDVDLMEYTVYREAITLVAGAARATMFSYLLRLFFYNQLLVPAVFARLAVCDLDRLNISTHYFFSNVLRSENVNEAIRRHGHADSLIEAMCMLHVQGLDPQRYTIDFLGCDDPVIKAQALIVLYRQRFLTEGRWIIAKTDTPWLMAVLLCAFKEDKELLVQLNEIVNTRFHPSPGKAIEALLIRAVLAKLSAVISESVIYCVRYLGYIRPVTAETFVDSKKMLYTLEQQAGGIDSIWHFIEQAVCARMSLLLGCRGDGLDVSDVAIFVAKNRGCSINLNPVHQQLQVSLGHYKFCDGVLRRILSSPQSPALFQQTLTSTGGDQRYAADKRQGNHCLVLTRKVGASC